MFSTYKCGFVPDTDVNYEMKPVKPKRNLPLLCEHILNYFKENHIVEDQNDYDMGPCYAMAGLYEYRLRTFISPLFFRTVAVQKYSCRDKLTLDDISNIIQFYGALTDNDMPHQFLSREDIKNIEIPSDVYKTAEKYCCHKIYTISRRNAYTVRSVLQDNPLIMVLNVYEKSLQNTPNTFWIPYSLDDKHVGYHTVVTVGYNQHGYHIKNSWGEKWGDDGYGIVNFLDAMYIHMFIGFEFKNSYYKIENDDAMIKPIGCAITTCTMCTADYCTRCAAKKLQQLGDD